MAAVGKTFEIERWKAALDRVTNGRLKAFAQRMIDNHGVALKSLQDAGGKPMMQWFFANLTKSPADMQDPRLDIVGKADLKGPPPTTVITDQIDPL